ncbi:MAG: hypothetical protein ACRC0J_19845, partial [Shewanella oncorhynchi]
HFDNHSNFSVIYLLLIVNIFLHHPLMRPNADVSFPIYEPDVINLAHAKLLGISFSTFFSGEGHPDVTKILLG